MDKPLPVPHCVRLWMSLNNTTRVKHCVPCVGFWVNISDFTA
ncbi:hypothetical protein [Caudoviricetes sp.]|nr:hypothetical protein [Caudoviricetes sp.]